MSNASKSFTSMQATRSHRRDVNGMVGQRSTFNQMRTFLRGICVPLQPAAPLKSTASAALQNGLMFQPHSESTPFTSKGSLVRVQLSPLKNPVGVMNQRLSDFFAYPFAYPQGYARGVRRGYAKTAAKKAGKEEIDYIDRAKKKNDFSIEDYNKKENLFGVIILESDVDMEPRIAYLSYHARWKIELVFDFYKNTEQLDQTCVQNDYTVIGNEFVNTITSIITNRMIQKAEKAELLKENTYGELLDDLNEAWRMKSGPLEARSDDEFWVHTLMRTFETLEVLGLSIPQAKPESKKRGRPRKNPPVEAKPKRPRGRPPKQPNAPTMD